MLALTTPTSAKSDAQILRVDTIAAQPAQRLLQLTEYVASHKLQGAACNLVLPPEFYALQQIERPPVDDSEMSAAAGWKIRDLLDYDLDDAIVEAFEFPDDALRGRPAQVNVVSARKTVLQDLITLVESSGLKLDTIDITELALRNLLLQIQSAEPPAKGIGLACLIMREHGGILVLVKDGNLYLTRRLDADMEGLGDPERQGATGQQLALEVQRSLDYVESQLGQVPPRRLFAASELHEEQMLKALDDTLGLQVLPLPSTEAGVAAAVIPSAGQWVACGAALRGQARLASGGA
ncbi:hypothetical protein GCM10022278_12740 [Allohahella marinimesophila]|uniref:MSHA biogenesis protein MshI n=1 Tax=Allohahella marinimesophila TaxID=1054972 RepID=A0ABP7NWJ6_9GAMM